MITISVDIYNPISQDFYDNTINNLQFHQLTCSCGLSGCLTIHGYYDRRIKTDDSFIRLHICRVKCSLCGITHALLLASIVPYSQISLPDQIRIISCYRGSEGFAPIMDSTPSIDENNISSVIRQYVHHWRQRLLSENILLSISLDFVHRCLTSFSRQFMQIKRTPNILFFKPT